jgi:hypothetical protein
LAPLAYYPAYLATTSHPTFGGFLGQWCALGNWPSGPAWFLCVLLVFDCAAGALYKLAPHWGETVNRFATHVLCRPLAFFCALTMLSALAYVPMALTFGEMDWQQWGPFTIQTSRIFHYAVYFVAGVVAGAGETTLLVPEGRLARRWILWPLAAVFAFMVTIAITLAIASKPGLVPASSLYRHVSFSVGCAASSLAALAVFLRFAKSRGLWMDNFCACAFGIYIIHYPVVTWLQHFLLPVPWSGLLKGLLTATGAVAFSWGLVALARRLLPGHWDGRQQLTRNFDHRQGVSEERCPLWPLPE